MIAQRTDFGEKLMLPVNGIEVAVRVAGSGPALLLLHGFPQNHRCWRPALPELAQNFTCIAPDLRGYGDSAAPPDDAAHTQYSKRTMAADFVGILDQLQIGRAHVLGHDRGARAAYRMAIDHPDRVARLGIVEIVPTGNYWAAWSAELAMMAYHWTFLAQPAPLPENMIGAHPNAFVDTTLKSWTLSKSLAPFLPAALASYRAQAWAPERRAAMCADYRAGATSDRADDLADLSAGRKITAPLQILAGKHGFPAASGVAEAAWREWAAQPRFAYCDSGHFVPEENPRALLDTFVPFFRDSGG